MNAAYVSAFAALAGSLIGGLTTFAAAWVTQRQQANVQWLLQEKTRRQKLYQQFIEEASKLYVDALIHDQAAILPFVSLYASINKMRVVSKTPASPNGQIRSFESLSTPMPYRTRLSKSCKRWWRAAS
jgi:hypothetical protein